MWKVALPLAGFSKDASMTASDKVFDRIIVVFGELFFLFSLDQKNLDWHRNVS